MRTRHSALRELLGDHQHAVRIVLRCAVMNAVGIAVLRAGRGKNIGDLDVARQYPEIVVSRKQEPNLHASNPIRLSLYPCHIEPPDLRHGRRTPVAKTAAMRTAAVGLPDHLERAGPMPLDQTLVVPALVQVWAMLEHQRYLRLPRA